LYRNPRIEKSFEAYNKVETEAVGNDSIAAAMYKDVADKYSNTPAGNLAALSAAEYLYDLGKYAEAAKYAEKFSTSDEVLMSNALVLIGDCYVNLKKYDDAISYFDKAISTSDENPQIVPRVLLKKATIYDAQNKYDKALECYEAISADYPQFSLGQGGLSIDAYVEREKARLGK
jgi:tetratricopeptide (TPR) repeat protein